MASSSSSSIYKSFKYDVFVSFRGEDTRKNFVDHLYYALQQKSIHTYKDDERIQKGKRISDELIKSIEDSKFFIIVFSKNYASSSWCLDELVKIMECHKKTGHNVYPVFYDVEPTEVRKQLGAVGEAFAKHEKEEPVEKWREAMKEAANLAGWELKNTADGHESKFIQKIVEDVSLGLRFINSNADGQLIGMETRVKDVVSSLETGFSKVRMIGIKGIGGGGKTTLARAVFDQISVQFEGKSFVENIKEVSKTSLSGLKSLQRQILSDLLSEPNITVSSVYEGKKMMANIMQGRKVLVVLDDVDHIDQLEALTGDPNWFKPGSRIIITTRDEQVLIAHGANLILDVNLLSHEEAICLFSRYAFGRDIPLQGYKKLSEKVVRYAAGLPLTLRVLGSFLCGKNELEWKDALERLKKIPLQETLKMLELSYDGLETDYKEIFLDVACILKGRSKEYAIRVLESCGFHARNGLRVLEQKSLITISDGEYLGMHDHIEEMGRNIVRRLHPDEPNRHSRLWIDKEIKDILANNLGTEATRSMKLSMRDPNPEILMTCLGNMKNLTALYMYSFFNWNFSEVIQHFPNALRYLSWHHYPFWSLSKTFRADNLVGLEMQYSTIINLFEVGERKVLNKLRFLDLSNTKLKNFDLGLTPNLEMLNLEKCKDFEELNVPIRCLKLISLNLNLTKVRTINLGHTPNLERLDLNENNDLVELHMPVKCLKLIHLNLINTKLRTLDLGQTPNLERLDLDKCYDLVELHAPTGCLKKLLYLNLSGCSRFESFLFDKQSESPEVVSLSQLHLIVKFRDICPLHSDSNLPKFRFKCFYKEHPTSTFGNIEKLVSFGLCACIDLEIFSENICSLRCLRKLTLEGGFPKAPEDLDRLECIEELIFVSANIKHLPDSICALKYLKSLKLKSCRRLKKLPNDFGQLEYLEELVLGSEKIKHLPNSFCMLKRLKSLKLKCCWDLEKLPDDFGLLENLEELYVVSLKIKGLPDSFCNLKHLKSFKLLHCSQLEKLPNDFGQLGCLEELILMCGEIKHLPDSICKLKYLKSLILNRCWHLKKLPDDFGRLENLEELKLMSEEIKHLPESICMLKYLKSLKLRSSWHLETIFKDLRQLECLEELVLMPSGIKHLPDNICMLKNLKSLKLSCKLIEKLPEDIDRLECLEKLILKGCELLQDIPPNICKMKRLKYFKLFNCCLVKKLPQELGRLECLEELKIEYTSISHLPPSIVLLEGLRIFGPWNLLKFLKSRGFTSKIQTSEDGMFFCCI